MTHIAGIHGLLAYVMLPYLAPYDTKSVDILKFGIAEPWTY